MERKDAIAELQPFIDGTDTASTRARALLLIVVMASILALSVVRLSDWMDARIALARHAIALKACDPWREPPPSATRKERLMFERAQLFCARMGVFSSDIESTKEIRARLEAYEEIRFQGFVFEIPIFGSAFDANDLGLIGGGGFVCLLLLLRYSLRRELLNLRLAFDQASRLGMLEYCFDRLSLSQVLTVAPAERASATRWPPKLALLAPVGALGWVLIETVRYYDIGLLIDPFQSNVMLASLVLAISTSFLLGIDCILASLDIDYEWDNRRKLPHERRGLPRNRWMRLISEVKAPQPVIQGTRVATTREGVTNQCAG